MKKSSLLTAFVGFVLTASIPERLQAQPQECTPGTVAICDCRIGIGYQHCGSSGHYSDCECVNKVSPEPTLAPPEAPLPVPVRHRYQGPVQLAVTSVLVAPRKDSGLGWDVGSVPALPEEAWKPLSRELYRGIFQTLTGGFVTPLAIAKVLPWALNAFTQGIVAPDVVAILYVDGTRVAITPKVSNSYWPSWPSSAAVRSAPLILTEQSVIEVDATDIDLVAHDHIGTCESRVGIPAVDGFGTMSADDWQCQGQLWAVDVRIFPVTLQN